jgi:ABC-type Fe3+-hydroxamate transport system substrate-binding protein
MQKTASLNELIAIALVFLFSQEAHAYSRIITLAPVISEWTAEILGPESSKTKIVGVSEYSNYPLQLKSIQTIGAYPKLNIEKIASFKPDLVLASSEYNRPEQLEQLKRLKINLQVLPKENFFEMTKWIRALASILQSPEAGESLALEWEKKIESLRKHHSVKKKTLFLEIQHEPLVTVGGASFLNDAFSVVGFQNVFEPLAEGYPKVSKESVLKEKPQAIFILDLTGNPADFEAAKKDWERYGFHPKLISGDDFARCSFLLLKGLEQL